MPSILYSQWEELYRSVMSQYYINRPDEISWKWTTGGKFTVKSMYNQLTSDEAGDSHSKIWKAKIPYKIKIFLWLLELGATLTKENMIKRNWVGDPTCRFCDAVETTYHLFFQCPTAKVVWGITAGCLGATDIPTNVKQYWKWVEKYLPNCKQTHVFGLAVICWPIWKARNKACFERKLIKHLAEINCHACSFMNFWTGLFKTDLQSQMTEGIKVMLSAAYRILATQHQPPKAPLRILPAEEDKEEQEGEE